MLGGLDVLDDVDSTRPRVRVAISALGGGGPDSGVDLPEPVLQARCGCARIHGHMRRPPLTVAGELGEYVTGAFAALGAATAWYRASRTGVAETVDVSKLEAMHLTMSTVPTLMARFPGGRMANFRFVMVPGNEPCADGNYVGITTVTIPQWLALLRAIGREDLCADDELLTFLGRFLRADDVHEALHAFTMQHTAEEMVDVCTAARVPAAVVGNGALLPEFEQPKARGTFVTPAGGVVDPSACPLPVLRGARPRAAPADRDRCTSADFVRLRWLEAPTTSRSRWRGPGSGRSRGCGSSTSPRSGRARSRRRGWARWAPT